MPLPLSPKSGFGMKVTVLPSRSATFLTMYLYQQTLSAIRRRESYLRSISACPAVATSWWWVSTSMPTSCMVSTILVLRSVKVSVGEAGK